MTKAYTPKKGYGRNPMLRLCRNVSCLCGSMKKVKKCCGKVKYVKIEAAESLQKFIDNLSIEAKKAIGYN